MIRGLHDVAPPRMDRRASRGQFSQQVLPLVDHLSARHDDGRDQTARSNLAAVEVVAALDRFLVYRAQVSVDRRARRYVRREASELRMVPVTSGLASQDGAREQRLTPERDEALWIEILRVQ